MSDIEAIEKQLQDFASEIQQANAALRERLPAVETLAGQYSAAIHEADPTDRQKINAGKHGNLITRLGELVQEMDFACERVTGHKLI